MPAVIVRSAVPEDYPRIKTLWQLAFGDSEALIDRFFTLCSTARACVLEDGVVWAVLFLLPVTLALPGGRVARGEYLYALCTHPAARGKGYAGRLIADTHRTMQAAGTEFIATVPARPALHPFFAQNGFSEYFSTREGSLTRQMLPATVPEDTAAVLSPDAYQAVRAAHLAERRDGGYVLFHREAAAFQQTLSQLQGGSLFGLSIAGQTGCAAVEMRKGGRLLCKELLLPDALAPRGAALLAERLRAAACTVRTPAWCTWPGDAQVRPFGMIKWYLPPPNGAAAYLGLALD